ncbi:MAG: sensor histidine kinase [Flavobacteriaceae bacterium]|nr:sensor histidine kinase [Flavobacteriaceae bacterium]
MRLDQTGSISVPDYRDAFIEISVIFMFWWAMASFIFYRIPYVLKLKNSRYVILSLIVILGLIFFSEYKNETPDKALSITLVELFWLVFFYLLAPAVFIKHIKLILSIFILLVVYFIYIRLYTNYEDGQKETIISLWMASIIFMVSLWVLEQWRWINNLKKDKADAELQLLKSQMNPHFFFNTLNNLYGLTVEKSDEAPKVILKLSEMMRYTIYEGKEDYVSLKDEVTYLQNYIDLHKIRFHQRLDISFDYSFDGDHKVAPLMFIILLENAFKHGVERLTENAYIQIKLKVDKDSIHFEIENNFDINDEPGTKGIGLDNLKKRLNLIYPKKHKFTVSIEENIYRSTLEIEIK